MRGEKESGCDLFAPTYGIFLMVYSFSPAEMKSAMIFSFCSDV